MRKPLAAFAIVLTLFGALAPYSFFGNQIQKNIAYAEDTFAEFRNLKVEYVSDTSVKLTAEVIYVDSENPNSQTNHVSDTRSDISLNIEKGYDRNADQEESWRSQDVDRFYDYEYNYNVWRQIVLTPDKMSDLENLDKDIEYSIWLEEENRQVGGVNTLSDKLLFKISDLKNGVAPTVIPSINNGGSTKNVTIDFATPPVHAINGDDTKLAIQTYVTYFDSTETTGDDYEDKDDIKLIYVLTKLGTPPSTTTHIVNASFTTGVKVGQRLALDIPIQNTFTLGDRYSLQMYDDQFTKNNAHRFSSPIVEFTVGDLNNATVTQTNDTGTVDNSAADDEEKYCGTFAFGCKLVVGIVQYLILPIPSFFATITGVAADFFLKLSIDPHVYGVCADPNNCTPDDTIAWGIRSAWGLIRDFTNIAFIFALFIAAFALILGKEQLWGFKPKETVVKVIIMALLVNFSMFACRMIIQTADVFSYVLYNKIGMDTNATNTTHDGKATKALAAAGIKSPSIVLVSKINPQEIITADDIAGSGGIPSYVLVSLISFFLYFIFIAMFSQMLFIFAGRIFGLWIGIILSPLAFVSYTIPFLAKDEYIGFENWIMNFTKLAFTTPIYLFFIYLAVSVLDINVGGSLLASMSGLQDAGWLLKVFYLTLSKLIPLLGAVFIFMYGKKIATSMSGIVGQMVAKVSGMASNLAVGAATGGTALLGRQTLGAAGSMLAKSDMVQKGLQRGGISATMSKRVQDMGNAVGSSTFDWRNSKTAMSGMNKFTSAADGKMVNGQYVPGKALNFGTKYMPTGGYNELGGVGDMKDRFVKEREDKAKADALDTANRIKKMIEDKRKPGKDKKERDKQIAEDNFEGAHGAAIAKAEEEKNKKKEEYDKEKKGVNEKQNDKLVADFEEKKNSISTLEDELRNLSTKLAENTAAQEAIPSQEEWLQKAYEDSPFSKPDASGNTTSFDEYKNAYGADEIAKHTAKTTEMRSDLNIERDKLQKEHDNKKAEQDDAKEFTKEDSTNEHNYQVAKKKKDDLAKKKQDLNDAEYNYNTIKKDAEENTPEGIAKKATADDLKEYNKETDALIKNSTLELAENLKDKEALFDKVITNTIDKTMAATTKTAADVLNKIPGVNKLGITGVESTYDAQQNARRNSNAIYRQFDK